LGKTLGIGDVFSLRKNLEEDISLSGIKILKRECI
jgi:hypothetical protein